MYAVQPPRLVYALPFRLYAAYFDKLRGDFCGTEIRDRPRRRKTASRRSRRDVEAGKLKGVGGPRRVPKTRQRLYAALRCFRSDAPSSFFVVFLFRREPEDTFHRRSDSALFARTHDQILVGTFEFGEFRNSRESTLIEVSHSSLRQLSSGQLTPPLGIIAYLTGKSICCVFGMCGMLSLTRPEKVGSRPFQKKERDSSHKTPAEVETPKGKPWGLG